MDDQVILVDEMDREVGTAVKMEAHEKGLLHRALSVFIFNSQGQLLLQKRALTKYHSGGLWSNTCCSHPMPGESLPDAAKRRLYQEMKISASLIYVCSFHYRTEFKNGLTENELDHVFYGVTDKIPDPDPLEASEWKYVDTKTLVEDINLYPENYTSWLKICIDKKILGGLIKY